MGSIGLCVIGVGIAYYIKKYKNKVASDLDKNLNNGGYGERSKVTGHSALMLDHEDNGMMQMNSEQARRNEDIAARTSLLGKHP